MIFNKTNMNLTILPVINNIFGFVKYSNYHRLEQSEKIKRGFNNSFSLPHIQHRI